MAGRWTQARRALLSQKMSQTMKARWADPEFRARMSKKMREVRRAQWRDPGFVDRQIEVMVQRWQDEAFRVRQVDDILRGRRRSPLADQPSGVRCRVLEPGAGRPCIRRGEHSFHVATTGTVQDGTLRLHGFRARTSAPSGRPGSPRSAPGQ